MKKGVTTLIAVMIVAMAAMMILVAWESRLLLAVRRQQAISDIIAASYATESEVFDIVGKYLYYPTFDQDTSYTKNFATGQSVQATVTGSSTDRTISILGKWPYASTIFSFRRSQQTSVDSYNRLNILIGFDCSSSMNNPSNSSTSQSRIRSAQLALSGFMDNILAVTPVTNRQKIYVGILPFQRAAVWYPTSGGQPSNDHAGIKAQLTSNTWNFSNDSPLCTSGNQLPSVGPLPMDQQAGTNLGDSGIAANTYLPDDPNVKNVFILFTDGLPNTAMGNTDCGTYACSQQESVGGCLDVAIDYLKCSLAPTNYVFNSSTGKKGKRLPNTDVYAVTVADLNTWDPQPMQDAYTRTLDVFKDFTYVKKYYANKDATQLSSFFADIFDDIRSSTSFLINFGRATPGP